LYQGEKLFFKNLRNKKGFRNLIHKITKSFFIPIYYFSLFF
jgi:hypothetical protein